MVMCHPHLTEGGTEESDQSLAQSHSQQMAVLRGRPGRCPRARPLDHLPTPPLLPLCLTDLLTALQLCGSIRAGSVFQAGAPTPAPGREPTSSPGGIRLGLREPESGASPHSQPTLGGGTSASRVLLGLPLQKRPPYPWPPRTPPLTSCTRAAAAAGHGLRFQW